MNRIDVFILDVTEWACRKFQLLTGKTNVWLAVQLTNLSIIVYFVWAGLYFWSTELWLRVLVGLFCGGVFYALTQTIFKVSIEEYEANAYRRVAKGFRNPIFNSGSPTISLYKPHLGMRSARALRWTNSATPSRD